MPPRQPNPPTFLTREQLAFEQGTPFSLEVDLITQNDDTLVLRGITKEGPFQYNIVPAAAGALETFSFRLTDMPVMFSLALSTGTLNAGRTHATVWLGINGSRYAILAQGSPSNLLGVNWPHSGPTNQLQLRGTNILTTGTNPAAGVEWSVTVPARQYWLVQSISVTLVSSAAAASRRLGISYQPAGSAALQISAPADQTASTTVDYEGGINITEKNDATTLLQNITLPDNIILPPTSIIASITKNFQGGDNWGAPIIGHETWYSP